MRLLIELTETNGMKILIGVESIVRVTTVPVGSRIDSRAAIAVTTFVKESVEEIYKLIND